MSQRNDINRVQHLTLRDLWQHMGLQRAGDPSPAMPDWPPDVFALCAAALKKSGAYTHVLRGFDSRPDRRKTEGGKREHAEDLVDLGQRWRRWLDKPLINGKPPAKGKFWKKILATWKPICDSPVAVHRIVDHIDIADALLDLLGIADEACRGVGLPRKMSRESNTYEFLKKAEERLMPGELGSTLCAIVPASVARVLPKMHTAQCGLTLRSLSHHLAFCESDEVRPDWISVPGSRGDARDISHMNIVVVPWPNEILPTQIEEIRSPDGGAFQFDIKDTGGKIVGHCLALLKHAEQLVGKVDAVVFPELSMTKEDYRLVRAVLLQKGILTIAGVGDKERFSNHLAFDVPVSPHFAVHFRQRKHHRWKLDKSQIGQYHLGSRLDPNREYWEHIDVQERKLNFVVLRPWMTTTALICEDLARHDPIGDLIKSVGPNLVIALLMDGPQIKDRWSARYASSLADDPGSSVLSITSLGMSKLSRPQRSDGKKSRVVALWKDALSGSFTEIDLPTNSCGVVITLSMIQRQELTADYRSDAGHALYPSLSGYHFLQVPESTNLPPAFKIPRTRWITPHEASCLARLVQRLASESASKGYPYLRFMPEELKNLHGSALRIGKEIWRLKTALQSPSPPEYALDEDEAGSQAIKETAQHIIQWEATNRLHFQGPLRP